MGDSGRYCIYILLDSVTTRLHLIVYKDEWKCKWRIFLDFVPIALKHDVIFFLARILIAIKESQSSI